MNRQCLIDLTVNCVYMVELTACIHHGTHGPQISVTYFVSTITLVRFGGFLHSSCAIGNADEYSASISNLLTK